MIRRSNINDSAAAKHPYTYRWSSVRSKVAPMLLSKRAQCCAEAVAMKISTVTKITPLFIF
jgi:hypothetical protein